ncbi:hypothetical protein JUN65_08380 [Gluconacetobacter azotocaptans]|uniref:hypothetical protein n=1 Tax=Gluconacetobacter azotocaptans TaxID=142834 RepID=UPI00195E3347|nr:hypothetical protein [Gluconacetobacter azotocaptans]MBM9401602.1 hypothetical protein [Gluconacetobacter azotocaptans]
MTQHRTREEQMHDLSLSAIARGQFEEGKKEARDELAKLLDENERLREALVHLEKASDLPSIADLDAAIAEVLTAPVADAIADGNGGNRTKMHDMAIRKAFVNGASDRACNALRRAAQALDKTGFYPSEMWKGQEDRVSYIGPCKPPREG